MPSVNIKVSRLARSRRQKAGDATLSLERQALSD
jgi:hypothetical protein